MVRVKSNKINQINILGLSLSIWGRVNVLEVSDPSKFSHWGCTGIYKKKGLSSGHDFSSIT